MEILLREIINRGWIGQKDKVLVVCGSKYEDQLLKDFRFTDYLITSAHKDLPPVKHYQQADAQMLPFANHSFDVVMVNAGLHHCASPHQALCEMYRVARKAVIVQEAQDSWLVRLMTKLQLVLEYEFDAVNDNKTSGGLNNTTIPNYIYRWSRREVRKTINTYDPTRVHVINFYSHFRYYSCFLGSGFFWEKKPWVRFFGKGLIIIIINLVVLVLNLVAKDQGNNFAFIIRKNVSSLQPWIRIKNKQPVYDR